MPIHKYVHKIQLEDVQLTLDIAEKLERIFVLPAGFWNKLEAIYQEKSAKKILSPMMATGFFLYTFGISRMQQSADDFLTASHRQTDGLW